MRQQTKTTLRLFAFSIRETSICVTSNGAGFQVYDTTRYDDAHFCCVFGLLDKFVQCFDIGECRLTQSLSSERHTNAHVRSRLLSQPQQLPQHTPVSSDLIAREGALQSSSSQINAQNIQDSSLTWFVSL